MDRIARRPDQLGAILRAQRRRLKLTQSALAAASGLRQATVSSVEAGEPGTRLDTILDLLAALDLELAVRPRSQASDIEDMF
ncbi:helix-turn-helix domain-containing protein [Geminicoccus roseus]|uniref:helix-turn-helix domain-containing protein n=1 Tax=Geminicoccus roseus TaxID=404900 RepID=UPI00041C7D5D|nr:helix-turn-helix domain-containing protein [Geminicoccus roseus]